MSIINKFKSNHLIQSLFKLSGNSRICVMSEPLWYIPYGLYIPFATVYMYRLGVNDAQIGLLLSLGMIVQVIAAFFGGVISDKVGRRKTTVIFDLISWSIPCLIWAFAQNFWWFLIAAILNSMWQITNNSWTSLLIEDCDKSLIIDAYSLIQLCGLLSVFLAPISTLLVENFDLVLVVRCLYVYSGISMTIKFLLLYIKGSETKQGKLRMEQTKDIPIAKLLYGYKDIFIKIMKSKEMLTVIFIMTSFNLTNTITSNFFGLYTTETLGVDDGFLAIFPMIRSAIMLFFMFTFQGKLNSLPYKPVMVFGYILFIGANVTLILSPMENVFVLIAYTAIEGLALVLISPRKDSLAALLIDKQERSRVTGLIYMIMIGFTAPFGWVIGILSSIDRRLPFTVSVGIFIIAILVTVTSKSIKKLTKTQEIS